MDAIASIHYDGIGMSHQAGQPAFTLAELLIALAVLALIATFTIPKVIENQTHQKHNAIAKESAGFVSEAYQTLQARGAVSAATRMEDLTPFLNYVTLDTAAVVDQNYGSGTRTCGGPYVCLRLHNGAMLYFFNNNSFGGTSALHAIGFAIDPDGAVSSGTQGPGKATSFWIYYNGKVRTEGTIDPGTIQESTPYNPNVWADPPYLDW